MAIAVGTNLSAFTLESDNVKTGLVSGSLRFANRTVSTRTISDTNEKKCTAAKEAVLVADMLNQTGGACPVMALNTTAFSVGGSDYLARLINLQIQATNMFEEKAGGVGDKWVIRQWTGQAIRGSCQLNLSTTVLRDILTKVASETLTDANVTLAFTLNGVQVSVPLIAEELTHSFATGQSQLWDINFGERGAATLPSGTTTMLERFLNTPSTSETLVLQSKAGTGGVLYGGEFLWQDYSLSIQSQEVVKENYTLVSTGAVTEGASS